jgi:molecular chaperone GrpE
MTSHKKEKKGQKETTQDQTFQDASTPFSDDQQQKMIENLQQTIQKMAEEQKEYVALLQRERADFINFKKRTEEEKKDIIAFGQGIVLLKWIPLYELFIKASSHLPDHLQQDEWVKGIMNIKDLFQKVFDDLTLQKIDTVGAVFNPAYHEAMMELPGPKGQVLQEFESGYLFHGRVIKAARVAVGNGDMGGETTGEKKETEPIENIPLDDIPTI